MRQTINNYLGKKPSDSDDLSTNLPTERTTEQKETTQDSQSSSCPTSTLPGPIKSTQPSHYPSSTWPIVLLVVAIVVLIASSVRLWNTIISPHAPTHHTAPATVRYDPASIVKANTTAVATPNATSTGTASGGTVDTSASLPVSYEAESPWNTLAGGTIMLGCPSCSAGERVGYIGWDGNTHTNGTLQFNNIYKNIGGKYGLTIYYLMAGIDATKGYMSVNGDPGIGFNVPRTAKNIVGTFNITISLKTGNNTIEFYNPSASAPDVDRIVV
ncbi:MAG TPA: hypothetical protein VN207_05220 [Ktedonobacteraceae bacterium]|nr:hypothetical protein [Ktedonobacteraceae bacterium]